MAPGYHEGKPWGSPKCTPACDELRCPADAFQPRRAPVATPFAVQHLFGHVDVEFHLGMDAAEHQKRSRSWKRNLDGFPGLLRTRNRTRALDQTHAHCACGIVVRIHRCQPDLTFTCVGLNCFTLRDRGHVDPRRRRAVSSRRRSSPGGCGSSSAESVARKASNAERSSSESESLRTRSGATVLRSTTLCS